MYRTFAPLFALLLSTGALAAETCGWLPASRLDESFPQYAPWSVMVGGAAGSCKFVSHPEHPANIFGANQMVQASADEAASFVASLRTSMAKSYAVAAASGLGTNGFTYRPKPGTGMEGRSVYFVAHGGKIAVIASLVTQSEVSAAEIAAATKLVQAALAIGDDPKALAAAASCPWFVTDVLKKLLPGKGFSQQAFGSNSCMAQAEGSAVIVSIREGDRGTGAGGDGCSSEPVAALGASGQLSWGCTGGRPHATVRYVSGGRAIEYNYSPGREPTAAERALLVELAQRAPGRSQ